MEARISKAQLEVWEWKEKFSTEILKIPPKDRLKYIKEKTKKTLDRIMKKKQLAILEGK